MQDWITGFAGLGLLFIGLRMVGAEVQQLAGGRARAWIAATLLRPVAPHQQHHPRGLLRRQSPQWPPPYS